MCATAAGWLLAAVLAGCGGEGGVGQVFGEPGRPVRLFSLSGTISVAEGTTVDFDVNDPATLPLPNDTFDQAQPLPNPVTVGGYVNEPGQGPPDGLSSESGDPDDYYRITLVRGQAVVVTAAEDSSSVPDLALYRFVEGKDPEFVATGAPVGGSLSTSVAAPEDGTYCVVVSAVGAGNYLLTAGAASTQVDPGISLAHDFVPGEAIAIFRGGGVSQASGPRARAEALGFRAGSWGTGRPVRLSLATPDAEGPAAAQGAVRSLPRALRERLPGLSPEARLKLATVFAVKALRASPDVVAADLNYVRTATAVPSDTHYGFQWHYPLIQAPEAWDLLGSSGAERDLRTRDVVVAVVDTGVVLSHPDLRDKIDLTGVGGYDFVSDPASAQDGDEADGTEIDDDPSDPGDKSGQLSSFHGTHVAGTIGATTDNNAGVAGVGWGVRLMPVRVLGRWGRGSDADVMEGMLYAAGLPNASGTVPAKPAHILNLSLGGSAPSLVFQDVVQQIQDAGVLIVAAAGNDQTSSPSFPAAFPGVVSVSAVDADRRLASYSNFGSTIDVAAPGGDASTGSMVLSTGGDDSTGTIRHVYRYMQGTSMAAPHVAGVAALMKAAYPSMSRLQFVTALEGGFLTDNIGDRQSFGSGLINAAKAVAAAIDMSRGEIPPLLVVSPSAVNFRYTGETATVVASKLGGALSIPSPPAVLPEGTTWLTVAPPEGATDGLGDYTFRVSREGLSPGLHTATVLFEASNGQSASVQVAMQVGNPDSDPPPDAGRHYVLLIDPAAGRVVDSAEVNASEGHYGFEFLNVPEGYYEIVAGTDMDNDIFICDPGEACGGYPTFGQRRLIPLDRDRTGLDFGTSFSAILPVEGAAAQAPLPSAVRRRPSSPQRGLFLSR